MQDSASLLTLSHPEVDPQEAGNLIGFPPSSCLTPPVSFLPERAAMFGRVVRVPTSMCPPNPACTCRRIRTTQCVPPIRLSRAWRPHPGPPSVRGLRSDDGPPCRGMGPTRARLIPAVISRDDRCASFSTRSRGLPCGCRRDPCERACQLPLARALGLTPRSPCGAPRG